MPREHRTGLNTTCRMRCPPPGFTPAFFLRAITITSLTLQRAQADRSNVSGCTGAWALKLACGDDWKKHTSLLCPTKRKRCGVLCRGTVLWPWGADRNAPACGYFVDCGTENYPFGLGTFSNHCSQIRLSSAGLAGAVARLTQPVIISVILNSHSLRHPAHGQPASPRLSSAKHTPNNSRSRGSHVNSCYLPGYCAESKTTRPTPTGLNPPNGRWADCALSIFRGVLDCARLMGTVGARTWGCLCHPPRRFRLCPEFEAMSWIEMPFSVTMCTGKARMDRHASGVEDLQSEVCTEYAAPFLARYSSRNGCVASHRHQTASITHNSTSTGNNSNTSE